MAKRPSRTASQANSSAPVQTQEPPSPEPASSNPAPTPSDQAPPSPHQSEPPDPKTGYNPTLLANLKKAAETIRTLDDTTLSQIGSGVLLEMLGGSTDQIPLVGTLGAKTRNLLAPTDEAPLGRVTHKVVRVFLTEVMAGRIPNDRRLAYTAIQHATALVVLEGYLWD